LNIINEFKFEYSFLSNFYVAIVNLDGFNYPSVEHAYQAAKTLDSAERALIAMYRSPATAKQLGRKVKLRQDWEQIKETIMLDLLRQKFTQVDMRQRLLNTGNARLIEGNYWNDIYWGVCNGKGLNRLGVLLMQVRDEINGIKL
jgi:ribA/ribD-fused uncharacterized protein